MLIKASNIAASMQRYDFLIVGSGIAGLSLALKLAKKGKVAIITKADAEESNTKYAQGGIAGVLDPIKDSFENHINDTLMCGDGACNAAIVKMVVETGPQCINEIVALGADFDKNAAGEYDLAKEGGHSAPRVLHTRDFTGLEIENTLLSNIAQDANIVLYKHLFAIDLLTEHHLGKNVTKKTKDITCFGVYAFDRNTGSIEIIQGKITILATGGAGHVYSSTTNPTISTGDGIAMAYRAKAKLENMEFIQFHPTALYNPTDYPSFLISEAVRGAGAELVHKNGETFMHAYDPRGSLAPRDIVARAIDFEMKKWGYDNVYLDCRKIPNGSFKQHFPTIMNKCSQIGIQVSEQLIPVIPAQHYMVGGIKVDRWGKTSIARLYACGECSSTGLHGANRLASNSLLEALVFSHKIAESATKDWNKADFVEGIPSWDSKGTQNPREMSIITTLQKEVQMVMSNYLGIVRSNVRLDMALDRLAMLHKEAEQLYQNAIVSVPLLELRNLIQVSYCIVKSARLRKESRGLHYNVDFPEKQLKYKATVI